MVAGSRTLLSDPKSTRACPTEGCSKSKEYVSLEEATQLRAMRAVREEARQVQQALASTAPETPRGAQLSQNLEQLRARFRELKKKLEQANLDKLRRLGHLVVAPLLVATLAACGGSAQQSPGPRDPAPTVRASAPQAKPTPAPPRPAPAPQPEALPPATAPCAISAGMSLPRGARTTAHRQLKSASPVQGRRLTFSRGSAKLVFPASALDHLRRFLQQNGPSNFPEERALLSQLEQAAAAKVDITIGPDFPWYPGSAVIMKRRISFLLADLLAAGNFEIHLPGQDGPVLEVTELEYSSTCGELCGAGGRVYVLPGCTSLFYTVDWVS